jgi:hypothetical protein
MKAEGPDMSVDQLVERFLTIALEQYEAILDGRYAKYNRLYDQMKSVEAELKRHDGDQRLALLSLLNHPNPQVRLKAAIANLAVAPDEAREALQNISDRNEHPQAADARGMMEALDDGTFKPN